MSDIIDKFLLPGIDTSIWALEGNGRQLVANGEFVARWDPGDSDHRCEISANSSHRLSNDLSYWIKFKARIDRFGSQDLWATMMQIHALPHKLPTGAYDWSTVAGRNPLTITLSGNKLGIAVNTRPKLSGTFVDGAIANQVWTSDVELGALDAWVINIIPSFTQKGTIRVWRNGLLVADHTGQNQDTVDQGGFPATPVSYLKLGVYLSHLSTDGKTISYSDVAMIQSIPKPASW